MVCRSGRRLRPYRNHSCRRQIREFFRGLARIGYDGPVVFESFSSAVVSPELSNTLGIWRNLWQDSDDLAAHANRFIRDKLRAVETISLH